MPNVVLSHLSCPFCSVLLYTRSRNSRGTRGMLFFSSGILSFAKREQDKDSFDSLTSSIASTKLLCFPSEQLSIVWDLQRGVNEVLT